jgi:Tfp pilus assembly protein PilV
MTMKPIGKFLNTRPGLKYEGGLGLLDVVLAIAVFAFGMLALVQLQGNLTRSSADANARTVAASIAEELLETIRGYQQVQADPENGLWDYLELEGVLDLDPNPVDVGGILYTRTVTVSQFWWDEANQTFARTETSEPPEGLEYLAYADFKLLRMDVSWDNSQENYVDDETTANLGTGSITVYEVIPSEPPSLGARVVAEVEGESGPVAQFRPGENPKIVALQLDDKVGGEKFKESSRAAPLTRDGKTWFDVVTYSTGADGAVFLRREEFVVANCKCTLEQADDPGEGGYRPTLWNGFDYTEGEFVAKDFGVSTSATPDTICDTCCRDHHDGGLGESDTNEVERLVYDPWSAPDAPPSEDHIHYGPTAGANKGGLAPVGSEGVSEYSESCRLIRKDGFFRVTHDFNQQAFFGFPYDYLDNSSEVAEYSGYVVEAVTDFVNNDLTDFKQPGHAGLLSPFLPPASSPDADPLATAPTNLPTPLGDVTQQLRSRGVYVDYLTDELRLNISKCPGDGCVLPGYTVPQEMYPFLEVQLTALSRWSETPENHPVAVVEDLYLEEDLSGNQDPTGLATYDGTGAGQSEVEARIHKGNPGFTGMNPVVPEDLDGMGPAYVAHNLYIDTVEGTPEPLTGFLVSGSILEGGGLPNQVKTANTSLTPNEAECKRTPNGYQCIVPAADPATITFTDTAAKIALFYCDVSGLLKRVDFQASPNNSWATFTLPKANSSIADIVIQKNNCGGG